MVALLWPSKLNQVLAGTSEGNTLVYFDSQVSTRGAVAATSKLAKAKVQMDYIPDKYES